MIRSALLFSVALLVGCGVSDNTELRDLDEDDWTALCEDIEEETFTCDVGGGVTYDITFGASDCSPEDTDGTLYEFPEGCDATVGDWRDCDAAYREALRADACTTEFPTECGFFETCFPQPE